MRAIVEGEPERRVAASERLLASYGHPEDDGERDIVSRLDALVACGLRGYGLRAVMNHVDDGAQTPSLRA